MEKLDYFCGTRTTPSIWKPCHLEEIIHFLKSRDYHLSVYKELDSSRYIVANGRNTMYFGCCSEICLYFLDVYFLEKEQEEKEYFARKKSIELKNENLDKKLYLDLKHNC